MHGHTRPFPDELQHALHHFYEPGELAKSPLIDAFGLRAQANPVRALQRILEDGIQSLKPKSTISEGAKPWKSYHALYYRFIEQSSQKMVAADLGVGIRQLRRIEVQALADLVEILEKRRIAPEPISVPIPSRTGDALPEEPSLTQLTAAGELSRWMDSKTSETVDAASLIESVLKTIQPMLHGISVRIDFQPPTGAMNILGDQTTLRQALLNIFTSSIQLNPGGLLQIRTETLHDEASIEVFSSQSGKQSSELSDTIEMARQLVQISNGKLEVLSGAGGGSIYRFQLRPAPAGGTIMMVVDDNQDALRLIQRYCLANNFRFVGTPDPQRALELAQEIQPAIILIDVMMPGLDGWELLGRLREHPELGRVPVIVSTIMPQEKFAFSLGAAGFLRKPFSQEEFVTVVTQTLKLAKGSR